MLGKSTTERMRLRQLALLPPEPTEEEKQFRALMDKASAFLHRFQLDSSAFYYGRALQYQPGNEEIIGSIAAIEEARRVQRQQQAQLRRAQEEFNQTMNNFLTQAETLYERHSYQPALDLLELIFDIDPNNTHASDLKARIERERHNEITQKLSEAQLAREENRLAEAIVALGRVLEIDPENAEASQSRQEVMATLDISEKLQLGIDLFERGRYRQAAVQFHNVLEVDPNRRTAREYLDRMAEEGSATSTLEDIEKDEETWALYLDGLRYMRNKEYQNAIDAWTEVLRTYPNNPNTLNNIEQARLRLQAQEPEN